MSSDSKRLLNVNEAAAWLGVSASWLNKARLSGEGPPYVKLGARIAYDPEDLVAWVASQKHQSTSEYLRITPFPDACIRAAVIAEKGEPWTASHLDPATWDAESRTITPATKIAGARLRDLRKVWPALGVTVADLVVA